MTASARNVETGAAEMRAMLRSCRRRLLRNRLLGGALDVLPPGGVVPECVDREIGDL